MSPSKSAVFTPWPEKSSATVRYSFLNGGEKWIPNSLFFLCSKWGKGVSLLSRPSEKPLPQPEASRTTRGHLATRASVRRVPDFAVVTPHLGVTLGCFEVDKAVGDVIDSYSKLISTSQINTRPFM